MCLCVPSSFEINSGFLINSRLALQCLTPLGWGVLKECKSPWETRASLFYEKSANSFPVQMSCFTFSLVKTGVTNGSLYASEIGLVWKKGLPCLYVQEGTRVVALAPAKPNAAHSNAEWREKICCCTALPVHWLILSLYNCYFCLIKGYFQGCSANHWSDEVTGTFSRETHRLYCWENIFCYVVLSLRHYDKNVCN